MTTSTLGNTSKSNCRCDKNCGCCLKKTRRKNLLGWLVARPWLLVIVAFMLMFSAWGVMIYFAVNNQPVRVPMTTQR